MITGLLIAYAVPVLTLLSFALWHNRKNKIGLVDIGVFLVLSVCWPLTLAIVAWHPKR